MANNWLSSYELQSQSTSIYSLYLLENSAKMDKFSVSLWLMWFSVCQVTSSAIPINVQAQITLNIDTDNLDTSNDNANIWLRMALQLSNGDQKTPKALAESTSPADNSIVATITPQPTTTTTVTVTSAVSADTKNACKPGFIGLGERCYYFSTAQKTWHNALRRCINLHADLVHPMSAEENALVTSHLSNNHKHVSRWWLGGMDRKDEGRWVWAHDTSPMSYTDWLSGEPNNDESNEDCAHYWAERGYKWNDVACKYKYQFICQQRQLDEVLQGLLSGDGDLDEGRHVDTAIFATKDKDYNYPVFF